jgi:endonuclease/exonuclease/phosphatase family metal-dependent hydrolase
VLCVLCAKRLPFYAIALASSMMASTTWHGVRFTFANMVLRVFFLLFLTLTVLHADPARVRVVAANLTSGRYQTYSPDNGNHSNIEGAGARILKGLQPDIVLIQEFNTTMNPRQWVNQTFGKEFSFVRKEHKNVANFIPNGVISRFPIVESGEWDDPTQTNRDFSWAKIRLPSGKNLWAISVHLYSKTASIRAQEAKELVRKIHEHIPPEDYVVLGGDLNTRTRDEECVSILRELFPKSKEEPADQQGNENTNGPRNKPYDWVLADAELEECVTPVKIGDQEFTGGLVFDSRVFTPLSDVPPVQPKDSETMNMQHMAVVRDFLIP